MNRTGSLAKNITALIEAHPKILITGPPHLWQCKDPSNLTSLREEGAVMMQTHPGGHADVRYSSENIKCYHNYYEMPS